MRDSATNPLRRAALAALLALAMPACQVAPGAGRVGGWDFTQKDKPELWGAYQSQGVYELQRDVFLFDVPDRTNGPALVPGMGSAVPPGTLRGPTGIDEYRSDPKRWLRVTGIVPAGTRLRAETLRGKGNLRDPQATIHYVRGRLLDSEFRGRLVDLQTLSIYTADADPKSHHATLTGPNEYFLTLVP